MKVAVLGAKGFLGKALIDEINKSTPFSVLPVSRGWSKGQHEGAVPLQLSELEEQMSSLDFIVNCAVSYGRTSSLEAYQANLEVPLELIRKSALAGVSFVSLGSFYGKFPLSVYSPLRSYSLSKSLLELTGPEVFKNYCRANDANYYNLRIEHLYGPGDSELKFVPWLVHQMISQVDEIQLTHGLQLRDFITVDDAAKMIVGWLKISREIHGDKALEIGTSIETSIMEFTQMASEITGYSGSLLFGALEPSSGEIQASSADPYLGDLLDMSFQSIEEGLNQLYLSKLR